MQRRGLGLEDLEQGPAGAHDHAVCESHATDAKERLRGRGTPLRLLDANALEFSFWGAGEQGSQPSTNRPRPPMEDAKGGGRVSAGGILLIIIIIVIVLLLRR